RQERERARWRLFLVHKRTSLKNRVHAQLLAFGHPCPVSDLFGVRGRRLLEQLKFPEPWRANVLAAVAMIDQLDREISGIEKELRALGADHRYVPLLMTVPGYWLGTRVHDRVRDRRHQPLRNSEEADRLRRPLPTRAPIRRHRSPRPP